MKNYKKILAVAIIGLSIVSCNNKNKEVMINENTTSLFPKGDKLPEDWFTGEAFLSPLVSKDKNNEFSAGAVTFEIGARTNWHTHPKGSGFDCVGRFWFVSGKRKTGTSD